MFLQPEHIEGSENSCMEDMVPLVSHRLPQVFCGALGASSDGGRSRTCSLGHALGTAPFLPSDARRWARAELPDRGRLRTTGSHSWVGAGGYGGQEPPCPPRSAWRSQCSVYVVTGKTDVTRSPWKPAWARPGRLSVCLSGGTKPSRAVGCLRKGVESAALASGDLLQSWQGLHFLDEEL